MRHGCREHVFGAAEGLEEALSLGDPLLDRQRSDPCRIEEDAAGRNAQADLRAAATVSNGYQNISMTVVTPDSNNSAKPSTLPSRDV